MRSPFRCRTTHVIVRGIRFTVRSGTSRGTTRRLAELHQPRHPTQQLAAGTTIAPAASPNPYNPTLVYSDSHGGPAVYASSLASTSITTDSAV